MTAPLGYSILHRVSLRLLVLSLTILGLLCAGIYGAAWVLHERAQQRLLDVKVGKLRETSSNLLLAGDDRFQKQLRANAQRRPGTRLELHEPDGAVFYQDPDEDAHRLSRAVKSRAFTLPSADGSRTLTGRFAIDVGADVNILHSLALVLVLATVVGALAITASAVMVVRRGLRPLHAITQQTERITRHTLGSRLVLPQPVRELQPWIDRFNELMAHMQDSYAQLEAFSADVAHELRTPLTALIGQTEVALTRRRSVAELGDTLAGNLEELHRIANLVNDMLFLARSDQGETARRGQASKLGQLVAEVIDFHEAEAAERRLSLEVVGDLDLAVDEPLFKRALSNLLSNATRYAHPGTAVQVRLEHTDGPPCVAVVNEGPGIAAESLPRLFDRFYRADASRPDRDAHHGLGLAIVAAIARMHDGAAFARSDGGLTTIGFSIRA